MPRQAPVNPPRSRSRAQRPVAIDAGQAAERWNRWRESLNPSRGLTIARAVSLVESYPRGEFADLMWAFGAPFMGIEAADPDLLAIIDRRVGAVCEMDWNAKAETGDDVDQALAEDQAAYISELMNGVTNLYDAIEHLEIAFNRGFAHLEMIDDERTGELRELRPIDQWNVVRRGIRGPWKYNPTAQQYTYEALPEDHLLDPAWTVIHEIRRPVGRVALLKYIRSNLSDKNWDAFMELFGLPTGVIIGPPDVDPDREDEYQTAAADVAKGGSGYLPHGSEWHPNPATQGRTTDPWETQLRYLSEKLILVGTGGKLTMLAESGSGTLAGSAHQEAFDQLARADARRISEVIQRQVIEPRLAAAFPEKDICAYWELAFREEVDSAQVIEDAATLSQAGYLIDPAELAEKSGYKLSLKPNQPAPDFQAEPEEEEQTENPEPETEEPDGIQNRQTGNPEPGTDQQGPVSLDTLFNRLKAGNLDQVETYLATALAEGIESGYPEPLTDDTTAADQ